MQSPEHEKIMLYLPSACSLLSIIGSCLNIRDIVYRIRDRRTFGVYHRLVLMMSLFDVLSSSSYSLANIPVPKGTQYARDAYGNDRTCTAQGFFNVLGVSIPYYNTSLSIYFLLKVRYGKNEDWLRRKAEAWMHIIPCIATFTTAILGLHFQVYNFSGNRCFLGSYPYGCHRRQRVKCIRGSNVKQVHYLFYGGIVGLFAIVLFCMTSLFLSIYKTEKKALRWHFPRSEAVFDAQEKARRRSSFTGKYRDLRQLKNSRLVARQAILYVSTFFLCYVWSYIIAFIAENGGRPPFYLTMLFYTFYPLQGFFNFVIYTIPRQRKPYKSRSTVTESASRRRSSLNITNFFNKTKMDSGDQERQQQTNQLESGSPDGTKHSFRQHSRPEYDKNVKQSIMPEKRLSKRLSIEGTKMLSLVVAAIGDIDEIDDDDVFIEEMIK